MTYRIILLSVSLSSLLTHVMFIAFFFMSFKLRIPLITVNIFFLIFYILYNLLNSISYFGVIFIFRNLITALLSEDEERGRKWLSNRILSGYKFSQVHSLSFIEDNFYLWMAVLSGKKYFNGKK
jgi:hypothetical protein